MKQGVWIFRRKPSASIMALLFLLVVCIWETPISGGRDQAVMSYCLANRVIVVDAGHGGFDPGAVGPAKHAEKDITLAISNKLAVLLSQSGALVINVRDEDEDLAGGKSGSLLERKRRDLAARVALAEANHADIFISIHTNADVSPRWSGAQTFYNGSSAQAKKMAENIQAEFIKTLGNTNRKAKVGNYYVTDQTDMAAVIVEVGFLSNPREEQLLINCDYQDKVAFAIFSGLAQSMLNE